MRWVDGDGVFSLARRWGGTVSVSQGHAGDCSHPLAVILHGDDVDVSTGYACGAFRRAR